MANPFSKQARSSSKDKFKNITGIGGGGHEYGGSSHMKEPGKHGVHKRFSGHAGHYLEGKTSSEAYGPPSKGRADRFARGGTVGAFARGGHAKKKKAAPENVTINISTPQPHDATTGMPPKMPPMPPPGGAPPGGAPPPGGPPPGGMPPGGANPMANPLAQGLGKGMGFARGGRTKGAHGGRPSGKKAASGHARGHSIGDSNYDLAHWRNRANKDEKRKADARIQADTQPVTHVQARAHGGKVHHKRSLPVNLPWAGGGSGVGRLLKAGEKI